MLSVKTEAPTRSSIPRALGDQPQQSTSIFDASSLWSTHSHPPADTSPGRDKLPDDFHPSRLAPGFSAFQRPHISRALLTDFARPDPVLGGGVGRLGRKHACLSADVWNGMDSTGECSALRSFVVCVSLVAARRSRAAVPVHAPRRLVCNPLDRNKNPRHLNSKRNTGRPCCLSSANAKQELLLHLISVASAT
jgi:hypothetical protein